MSWCELATSDTAEAGRFYSRLFGWGLKAHKDLPYTELIRGSVSIGGILPIGPEMAGMPPHWLLYFQVTDCDAAAVKSLGGQLIVEPKDIPTVGRFGVIQDPQGARFAIIKLG